MKTRSIPKSLSPWDFSGARGAARSCPGPRPPNAETSELLLVSDDASLGENLRRVAVQTGRAVVQVDRVTDALRRLRAGPLAAVLLDLDLPAQAAWEAADGLLQEQTCPPLILLTARSDQFDVSTAIRAGSLVDKTIDPRRLLDAVDATLAAPCSVQAERNAIQRVMIRWLRPCGWPVPLTPTHHYSRINE